MSESEDTQPLTDHSPCLCLSGSTAGHSDGRVLAVHPEHFWGDPLPADDLDGRDRRRFWLLHNRLHVLLHSEYTAMYV